MRLALAIASFVVLLVHGVVFYKQFFHKWENYQTAYFDQARSLAKSDAEHAGPNHDKVRGLGERLCFKGDGEREMPVGTRFGGVHVSIIRAPSFPENAVVLM